MTDEQFSKILIATCTTLGALRDDWPGDSVASCAENIKDLATGMMSSDPELAVSLLTGLSTVFAIIDRHESFGTWPPDMDPMQFSISLCSNLDAFRTVAEKAHGDVRGRLKNSLQ